LERTFFSGRPLDCAVSLQRLEPSQECHARLKLGGFRGRAGAAEDTAKARKAHPAKARAQPPRHVTKRVHNADEYVARDCC
jgi:hypothetical protein